MLHVAALKPTTLKSSLSASASSVVLASLEDRHGEAVTLATFGEWGTIVVKSGDQWECIKFDGLVNNADGSVTLTVATNGRKILPVSPFTGSATGFDFIAGSDVIVTNDGLIMSAFGNVENAQAWAEIQTFSQPPVVPTPVNGTDAANKDYVDGVALAGAPNASTSTKGVTKLSVAPVSPTAPIAVGDNDGRVPTQSENDALVGSSGTPSSSNKFVTQEDRTGGNMPVGSILQFAGASAPTGWLLCDGSTVSRATYASLFSTLNSALGTVTITIATPGVVSFTAHGLATGDSIYLTTTGALPTGLSANTRYWIIKNNADSFWLASSLANALAGTKIATSGSQSGVHTATVSPYGVGDGSTTFTLPSFKGVVPVGKDQSATEFAGLGQTGGEKTHVLTATEMPSHTHSLGLQSSSGTTIVPAASNNTGGASTATTGSAGSDGAHNNLQPYIAVNFIIKT